MHICIIDSLVAHWWRARPISYMQILPESTLAPGRILPVADCRLVIKSEARHGNYACESRFDFADCR